MKIIVVGGGKVGTALCRSLVAENHDVILIEQDEAVVNHITKRYDIIGIVGNGANFKILEQADVADCDIFVALTEQDEVNMVSAVLAKKMGAKETVVRVRNPEYSNPYFKEKNILGFSLVVNPELLAARYIANSVDFPNALSVEHFASGRVAFMEFKIKEESPLCQMTLSQFRKKYGNIIICAIERQGQLTIPDGDFTLQAFDKIFMTGNRVEIVNFHNSIRKIDLKVIEIDQKRAEWFSQEFPDLYVIQGDGTSKDILMEERASNFDAVATLTGVDEENIIASMFLNSIGVQKNITKVNRTSLLEIIDRQDFSSIVTPKGIAVDTIMHFIRGRYNARYSNLEALHHVANGQIETLQFQIREENKMTGKPLAQLKLKKGVLIAAIIRNGKAIFPTGDDHLLIGDRIIVTTLISNITKIYDLLEG